MVGKSRRSTKSRRWSRSASEDAEFEDGDDDDFPSINLPIRNDSEPFPFNKLDPEIKNMIYHHLVVPDHGKPLQVVRIWSRRSQISTAILYVDRQLHQEASAILYTMNTLQIYPFGETHIIRKDQDLGRTRRLRNGRLSGNTKFTGIIYPHVLRRFRKIQLALYVELYGTLIVEPLRTRRRALAVLKELLLVVCNEAPVQKGFRRKALQLEAFEPDYTHRQAVGLQKLTIQSVISELEKLGFPAIYEKLRKRRSLAFTGKNLCADTEAALWRCFTSKMA